MRKLATRMTQKDDLVSKSGFHQFLIAIEAALVHNTKTAKIVQRNKVFESFDADSFATRHVVGWSVFLLAVRLAKNKTFAPPIDARSHLRLIYTRL